MRAVRFLTFALLLVAGLAGVASAEDYSNTPGVYTNIGVGVTQAITDGVPSGDASFGDIPALGPNVYRGTLTVARNGNGTYTVGFQGEAPGRAKLIVNALFSSAWVGVKIGNLPVETSLEADCIKGIDGMHLLSANINGVGLVDGVYKRVIAKFSGDGSTYPPTLTHFNVNPAPGFLR